MTTGSALSLLTKAGNAGSKSRMAGNAWNAFLQWLKNSARVGALGDAQLGNKADVAKALALRFTPDVLGGTIVGATTPGDLNDKLIAGTTDALAGAIGGVGLSGGLRLKGSLGIAADMAGSMGGAYASMPISEQLLRTKDSLTGGSGMSPYEKLSEQRKKQIENDLLTRLGFGPMY